MENNFYCFCLCLETRFGLIDATLWKEIASSFDKEAMTYYMKVTEVQLASTTATHVYLNPTTGPMKSIATRDQDSNRLPSTVEFSRAKEKSKESIGN
ncbi:hypothetical protein Hdeb2414_s0007g00248571 [Helianthus debilis subsp. tardiflorus]